MVKKKNKVKPQPKKNNSCVCNICKRIIFTKTEDYCHLEDFHMGEFWREGFYHTKCFNEKIKGTPEMNAMKRKAMKLLNAAGKMINIEEEPVEVVYV